MKFVFFLKSRLIFKMFFCFCMFVNKHFINTSAYISKSKRHHNAKTSAYYFYVRTKIPSNFHICIGVPLMIETLHMLVSLIAIVNIII